MVLFRNRLIFGFIKNVISTIFTVVLKIFQIFNLQFTLLIGLIGAILYITGTFDKSPVVLLVFELLIIFSVFYAIVATIKKLLGLGKKKKRSEGAQIVNQDSIKEESALNKPETNNQENSEIQESKEQKPIYYRVKGKPNFYMAEYANRIELYKKTETGLVKIRTDYKGETE